MDNGEWRFAGPVPAIPQSLALLRLPPAALGSLPTASVRTGFAMTLYSKCGVSPGRRADRGVRPYMG